ncbi:MAG TPA: hypothetical protein PK581_08420 [Caldisericia bacterium]|nr:hypothetical protein [Caldisericia bacterium]
MINKEKLLILTLVSIFFLVSCKDAQVKLQSPDVILSSVPSAQETIITKTCLDQEGTLWIAGNSKSNSSTDQHIFVSRISPDGNLLWTKYLKSYKQGELLDIKLNHLNELDIIGISNSQTFFEQSKTDLEANSKYFFTLKVSSEGQLLEKKKLNFPSELSMHITQAILTKDNVLFIGNTKGVDVQSYFSKQEAEDPPYTAPFLLVFTDRKGQVLWSKPFGSEPEDKLLSLLINEQLHTIYLAGSTKSNTFPVKDAFQAKRIGAEINSFRDSFVSCFDYQGIMQWSTYLGGMLEDNITTIAIHPQNNNIHVFGSTGSDDFPLIHPTYSVADRFQYMNNKTGVSFQSIFNPKGQVLQSNYLGKFFLPILDASINPQGNMAYIGYGSLVASQSMPYPFQFKNPLQLRPVNPGIVFGKSNFIAAMDSKEEFTFFSFYGGTDEKDESNFQTQFIDIANSKTMFVSGSMKGLTPERFEHLKLDPVVFSVPKTHTLAFVSIFDTEGNFKKMLLWGAEE